MSIKTRFNIMLTATCILFAYAWAVSAVAFVVLFEPAAKDPVVLQKELHVELDAKYSDLLQQANLALQTKEEALQELQTAFLDGYVDAKDIVVTDVKRGYWLSEPKLMLGVRALNGGQLRVNFAHHSASIAIGQRLDFTFEDCDCFLLLKSSSFGNAEFRYACSPQTTNNNEGLGETFVQAQLK